MYFFSSQNLPDLLLEQVPLFRPDGMHVAFNTIRQLFRWADFRPSAFRHHRIRLNGAVVQRKQ
jgi:hypothetical protein